MSITVNVASEVARFQDDDGVMQWLCFDTTKMPGKYSSLGEAKQAIYLHANLAQTNWASLSRRHTSQVVSVCLNGKDAIIVELLLDVDREKTALQRSVYTINVPSNN